MAYAQPHHELIGELLFPGPGGRSYPNDQRQIMMTFVLLAVASVMVVAVILASLR